jgi:hypothetical protein
MTEWYGMLRPCLSESVFFPTSYPTTTTTTTTILSATQLDLQVRRMLSVMMNPHPTMQMAVIIVQTSSWIPATVQTRQYWSSPSVMAITRSHLCQAFTRSRSTPDCVLTLATVRNGNTPAKAISQCELGLLCHPQQQLWKLTPFITPHVVAGLERVVEG